jgi:uncharacterized protein (TIGR04255 family)
MRFAPLRYTLAMARFPRNTNVGQHVPAFQELVGARYPLFERLDNRAVNLKVGPQGAEVETTADEIWQFSEASRSHAVILGGEYLVLHAGADYEGHEKFVDRFCELIDAYCKVDGLRTVLIGAGYRYVDLIVPRPALQENLGHYLQPWVLPPELLDMHDDGVEPIDSIFVGGFRTNEGVMRLQIIRRPPGTMPPDLDTKFVRDNGWVDDRPADDFALLDIDHGTTMAVPVELSSDGARKLLLELRIPPARLFDKATTDHAKKVWRGEA